MNTSSSDPLFRQEALDYYDGAPGGADLLRISPLWIRCSYWLLLSTCLACLLGASLSKVSQYASGPAVIRFDRSTGSFYAQAMLPCHHRPILSPGMPVRLELGGYRFAYVDLTVDAVSDVMGPEAVRRDLPAGWADTVALSGPLVVIRARLSTPGFLIDGRLAPYFEGMQGTVAIRLRSESLLLSMIPAWKAFHGR